METLVSNINNHNGDELFNLITITRYFSKTQS